MVLASDLHDALADQAPLAAAVELCGHDSRLRRREAEVGGVAEIQFHRRDGHCSTALPTCVVRRGNRFLEILATIYLKKSVGARDLAAILGGFTTPDLSRKLRVLEAAGLVESGPSFGQPDRARFSLTHKGIVIARIGEPVFLYLRLAEGWTTPTSEGQPAAKAAENAGVYEAAART